MKKKIFRILSFVIVIALMAGIVYMANPAELIRSLAGANLLFAGLGIAITLIVILLKILRWKILLNSVGIKPSLDRLWHSFMSALIISNFTPGRVGEPLRAVFLKRMGGSPGASEAMPTIVVERMMDMIAILVFSFIGFMFFNNELSLYLLPAAGFVLAVSVIASAMIVSRRIMIFVIRIFQRTLSFIPAVRNFESRIEITVEKFNESVRRLKPSDLLLSFALSFMIWGLESAILYTTAIAVGIDISFQVVLGILSFSMLIGVVSSLPGGLGSTEAVMTLLLASFSSAAPAAAASFIYRFASFWFGMILCVPSLSRIRKKQSL